MDLTRVINEIVSKNRQISEIYLKEFPHHPILQDRLILNSNEAETLDRALKIRNDHKFSFWDSLLSTYIDGSKFSHRLLSEAFHHNEFIDIIRITRDKFEKIDIILDEYKHKKLALSSKVKIYNNKYMHIPMIDFHMPTRSQFPLILHDIMKLIGQKSGFFLESGESYHFYGTNLLTQQQLFIFLGKSLRFAPIIDKSWISHQIEEKCCALRVGYKNGVLPKIVLQVS